MEPPEKTELPKLTASRDFKKRLALAKRIGNFKPDPAIFRREIIRTAIKHLKSKGVPSTRLNQLVSLHVLPPSRNGLQTTGSPKIFALLIDFPDCAHINNANTIDGMLFGNPSTGIPYESLANYYRRASYNKLDLSGGATLGYYRTSKKRSEINQDDNGRESLIKEALLYFKNQGHNFAQYDNDNDGFIDYFLVFWAGPVGQWGTFWWGWCHGFSDSSFKLDGKSLKSYSWQWESGPINESTRTGEPFNTRIAIHETGHALGLPDLYDYDSNEGPVGGVGGADMMDGNWLDHNCFSKWMLGWLSPTIIGSGVHTVTLKSSGRSGDCVAIWPYLDEGEIFSEMFMVQNRQPGENDRDLPRGGLMIWHIDARLDSFGNNFGFDNSFTPHKLVRLMEADGLETIENKLLDPRDRVFDKEDLYNPGKTFGQNTSPSSRRYDGRSSFIEVSNIKSTISVRSAVIKIGSLLHHAVWGWARKDFDQHQSKMELQGYRLSRINAYVPSGGRDVAWNGIWTDVGEDLEGVWGWSKADFDKHQAELEAKGYRLTEINAYVSPGARDATWNGIWIKTGEDVHAVWGWARKDFDKHQAELVAQGYRLLKINAYVPPGARDAAWNGIWIKTEEDVQAVWGWARNDFDKHQAELQAQGYNLTEINAYVSPGARDAAWNGIWVKRG